MSFNPDSDLSGTIARLFVYPVKSCAGIEVQEALLTETGLDLDRAWMVVDAHGAFLTQRALPRMALIRPQLKTEEMVVRAPGMLALHVAIDAVEAPATVTVWRDTVPAWDMGAVAAQWFTDFLGQPCRLVRFDPDYRRLSSMDWTGGIEAPNQFSDGFPVLVASEASMQELNDRLTAAGHGAVGIERFRPNVVLGGVDAHDEDRVDMVRVDGGAEGE
ncbi:MAG: MOSC domain-containing protein, partial [Acidovorax sp.]